MLSILLNGYEKFDNDINSIVAAEADGQHDPYVSTMLHRWQNNVYPCKLQL